MARGRARSVQRGRITVKVWRPPGNIKQNENTRPGLAVVRAVSTTTSSKGGGQHEGHPS